VKEGFVVMPYTNDDVVTAKKLRDAGAACVMPLGAPIGSGLGIQNFATLRLILEEIREIPVIVDAGVGVPSDAAIAMESGADGVLMNTAIAGSPDPAKMAAAMKLAVEAGVSPSRRAASRRSSTPGEQPARGRRPLGARATAPSPARASPATPRG